MKLYLIAASALLAAGTAEAQQFDASPGIFTGSGYAASYNGPGGNVQPSNKALGSVWGGGADTFDAFGWYNTGTGGLALTRQVELLSGNTFRFFDTFTNNGSNVPNVTVNFFGNLGSDGDELVSYDQGGLIVSCEDDGAGACTDDAVIALVSGNNGLGKAAITPDRYNASYLLNVLPGQSVSLLNYAFLARDVNGPTADDVALATSTGQALLAAPRLEGLSDAQVARIVNFAAPVPEPKTWAMMLAGFALVGVALRRRRSAMATA
ncbi:PEPxxWA-CTERM sorting domain-containing protein [Sphingomonas phyllosphaerae]|uniref:PEPxxWA-CTERM sorting domain-containing protein n=1 Tax=Sphingomonas phyllosphaerae TaxID=257003 RepID=UPI000404A2F4|nr:PEPxxWA-CTERM sorting domain-containing protein [Sphingomonas phyllosphaerae]